jgi:hypothetical protein
MDTIRHLPRGILRLVLTTIGALVVGLGVPALWIWIGSMFRGTTGESSLDTSSAAVVFLGILLTYVAILFAVGWVQDRFMADAVSRRSSPRHPWNRSMRDEPYRPGERTLNPLESVFAATAVIASLAFLIWFFAFAGSPLPQGAA